jgi:hypothetical protein
MYSTTASTLSSFNSIPSASFSASASSGGADVSIQEQYSSIRKFMENFSSYGSSELPAILANYYQSMDINQLSLSRTVNAYVEMGDCFIFICHQTAGCTSTSIISEKEKMKKRLNELTTRIQVLLKISNRFFPNLFRENRALPIENARKLLSFLEKSDSNGLANASSDHLLKFDEKQEKSASISPNAAQLVVNPRKNCLQRKILAISILFAFLAISYSFFFLKR